jgi:hypothetical protein
MNDLGSSSRKQATAFGQYRAILGAKSRQEVVRKTLAVSFVGAVYALIGVVMSDAYHEFGQQSLRNVPPLVMADRTPVKIPGDPRQVRTAPRDRSHSAPSATLPLESGDRASAESRVVQATAPLLADRPSSPADRLAWIERSEGATGHRASRGGPWQVGATAGRDRGWQCDGGAWPAQCACRGGDGCATTRASVEAARAHSDCRGRDDRYVRSHGRKGPDPACCIDVRSAHSRAEADRSALFDSIRPAVVAG